MKFGLIPLQPARSLRNAVMWSPGINGCRDLCKLLKTTVKQKNYFRKKYEIIVEIIKWYLVLLNDYGSFHRPRRSGEQQVRSAQLLGVTSKQFLRCGSCRT